MKDWYFYFEKGAAKGPILKEDLDNLVRTGHLKALDLIYRDGMQQWTRLGDLREWHSLLENAPAAEGQHWVLLLKKKKEDGKGYYQEGPLSSKEILERLNSGAVSFRDYGWKEGLPQWTLLADLEEFDSLRGSKKSELRTKSEDAKKNTGPPQLDRIQFLASTENLDELPPLEAIGEDLLKSGHGIGIKKVIDLDQTRPRIEPSRDEDTQLVQDLPETKSPPQPVEKRFQHPEPEKKELAKGELEKLKVISPPSQMPVPPMPQALSSSSSHLQTGLRIPIATSPSFLGRVATRAFSLSGLAYFLRLLALSTLGVFLLLIWFFDHRPDPMSDGVAPDPSSATNSGEAPGSEAKRAKPQRSDWQQTRRAEEPMVDSSSGVASPQAGSQAPAEEKVQPPPARAPTLLQIVGKDLRSKEPQIEIVTDGTADFPVRVQVFADFGRSSFGAGFYREVIVRWKPQEKPRLAWPLSQWPQGRFQFRVTQGDLSLTRRLTIGQSLPTDGQRASWLKEQYLANHRERRRLLTLVAKLKPLIEGLEEGFVKARNKPQLWQASYKGFESKRAQWGAGLKKNLTRIRSQQFPETWLRLEDLYEALTDRSTAYHQLISGTKVEIKSRDLGAEMEGLRNEILAKTISF